MVSLWFKEERDERRDQRITQPHSRLKHIHALFRKFYGDLGASFSQGTLAYWSFIAFALGILAYFSLHREPSALALIICALFGVGCALLSVVLSGGRWPRALWLSPLAVGVAFVCFGFSVSGIRTRVVAAPTLSQSLGPTSIEGWVERDDQSPKMRRLRIKVRWIGGVLKKNTPNYIQISAPPRAGVTPGRYVSCVAFLTPPPPPVTPGGYDFARHAYFDRIGATGFARWPCEPISPPAIVSNLDKIRIWLSAVRRSITVNILGATEGGSAAGFVAALATGDESGISQNDVKSLQTSGLAHLLAVSGMNMTLVGGVVYLIVRFSTSLIEPLALRTPVRSVSAATALVACAGYWALTGGGAATTRAFIMAAISFGAVMINRPAITMRGLAFAGLLILISTPEALISPGFQMSFAATLALVGAFEAYKTLRNRTPENTQTNIRRITSIFIGALLTTVVAGTATAPFSAYHFQTIAAYGFLSNLAASPIISLIVTPACVLAAIAAPFGLSEIPLRIAEWGSQLILDVSNWVSSRPDAISPVAIFNPIWLVFFSLGLVALCLLRGWSRILGVLAFSISAWGVIWGAKPIALISDDAKTIYVQTQSQFLRSRGAATSFVQSRFRQAIGLRATAMIGDIEEGSLQVPAGRMLRLRGEGLLIIVDKPSAWKEVCAPRTIIVFRGEISSSDRGCQGGIILDVTRLNELGGVAILSHGGKYRVDSIKSRRGDRPWVSQTPQTVVLR